MIGYFKSEYMELSDFYLIKNELVMFCGQDQNDNFQNDKSYEVLCLLKQIMFCKN